MNSVEVDEDIWLARYGLHPRGRDLDAVRELLAEQTRRERKSQGHGDTILMKLCVVQLFTAAAAGATGPTDDVLLIWRAKRASFDAGCSIDVQLLCGGGLDATKAYLAGLGTEEGEAALRWITHCEESEDFEEFTPAGWAAYYAEYYAQEG
ncbi:hypothetical protein [Streptomyces tritici]|uniref:hypothetical protein n=1 Tax=Streptomyces tritici TaxID=2054410 RepID=UPI003AEF1936